MNPRLDNTVTCDFRTEFRAHVGWIWNHPYATKIKAIRIPASSDGRIIMLMAVRVPYTCVME